MYSISLNIQKSKSFKQMKQNRKSTRLGTTSYTRLDTKYYGNN